MKPSVLTMAAAGASLWCPINQIQNSFGIGLGASVTSGANLTYSVQHTFDDTTSDRKIYGVTLARSGTTATITIPDHRLSVNDNLLVEGAGDANLNGSFAVASVVDANNVTYTVSNTGAASGSINTSVITFRVYNHATMSGQTGRLDGNYAFAIQAIRLTITAYVSGKVDLTILQGMGR